MDAMEAQSQNDYAEYMMEVNRFQLSKQPLFDGESSSQHQHLSPQHHQDSKEVKEEDQTKEHKNSTFSHQSDSDDASQVQSELKDIFDSIDLNDDEVQVQVQDSQESAGSSSSSCEDSQQQQIQGQHGEVFRLRKKSRKIRTTITREKLYEMNKIFADYMKTKEDGKNPIENLKQIGNKLSLGYSTILHKYRQFRSNKMVKGGALIASLQKKRKYRKSLVIEKIIEKALAAQPFYTAVELAEYIYRVQNRRFSRSIISRHLGQMGYSYKNLKSSPIEKNKPRYKATRRAYANIMYPYLCSRTSVVLYIDELACSMSTFQRRRLSGSYKDVKNDNQNDYVSVIMGVTNEGVCKYQVKKGFYDNSRFAGFLRDCVQGIVQRKFNNFTPPNEMFMLITDMNKIHFDDLTCQNGADLIRPIKEEYNFTRAYLPPSSPHLNPLESIFNNLKAKVLKKGTIRGVAELMVQMQKMSQEISRQSVEVYFKDTLQSVESARHEDVYSSNESNDYSSPQNSSDMI